MNSKERLLAAIHCKEVDRPPFWVMRQAGRYLPEYRELKKRYDFLTLAKTPELAAEVTLQPLARFPLDAAIIFSDILVIPEAMGQGYHFREQGGIGMEYAISNEAQIDALSTEDACEKLSYVFDALKIVKKELKDEKALLGFCGSPWTLACYMVQGEGGSNFNKIKELFFENRDAFEDLMEKLTTVCAAYIIEQIKSGIDAVQIFDSWGALCPGAHYVEMSAQWISRILNKLPEGFPAIVYAKGMSQHWNTFVRAGAQAIAVDWTVKLPQLRHELPANVAIQGNMDPVIMTTTPGIVGLEVNSILESMRGHKGFIFNLGHGITPNAKVENMEELSRAICSFK